MLHLNPQFTDILVRNFPAAMVPPEDFLHRGVGESTENVPAFSGLFPGPGRRGAGRWIFLFPAFIQVGSNFLFKEGITHA
jgi:hypothetical protein